MSDLIPMTSCLPVSLYPRFRRGELDIPAWSAMAREMGLDAIDINAFFLEGKKAAEIEAIRKQLQIPVLMVSTYSDFTNPDAPARREAIRKAKQDIEAASILGARFVRLTAGPNYPHDDDAPIIRNVCDCFESCLPAAVQYRMTVLLENHSRPGAWQYDDFNFHRERFLNLWQALRQLPVMINFDIANAYALGDWQGLLAAVSDRLATLHVNDLASVDPLTFCLVGEGIVPVEEMLLAILQTGFAGPACLEEAAMREIEGMKCAVFNTRYLLSRASRQLAGR